MVKGGEVVLAGRLGGGGDTGGVFHLLFTILLSKSLPKDHQIGWDQLMIFREFPTRIRRADSSFKD